MAMSPDLSLFSLHEKGTISSLQHSWENYSEVPKAPHGVEHTMGSQERGSQALAGVVQWIEGQLANQRVASSIPSQGTCLGWRPGPQ